MSLELSEARKRFVLSEYAKGFIAYCGLEAVEVGPGWLEARVVIRDEHRQQDGFIHAGVMATMADHTAGYAAYSLVPEDRRILTIEFKINFLRPAYGDLLICRGRVIKPGRKVLICEAEVFDVRAGGEILAAKNLATMASVPVSDLRRGG